jgi:hypothetical protein
VVGIAELVAEYVPRLRAASNPSGAKTFGRTVSDFCASVGQLDDTEAEIADGLRGLLVDRDPARVVLWLHAAMTQPCCELVEPLCALLSVRDAYIQHEWVAELLGAIGDPHAVAALSEACSFEIEGDPFRSLPKCCLQALAEIGTPTAFAAIEAELSSPWPEVQKEAARLLAGGRDQGE